MTFKSKTILVVDDDEDILKLLNKILSTAGFRVLEALNVEDGKKILESEVPHVILTDLQMRPLNGFDFIEFVKTHKKFSTLPILVLSSLSDFQSVRKAIVLGVNDYVIKPFRPAVLLNKLRKALHNHDFLKWEPANAARPELEILIDSEVTDLGEAGCSLKGPYKITTAREVEIISEDFSHMGLEDVHFMASPFMKSYQSGGVFLNDITFVGISEQITSRIRQFVLKRK